MVDSITGALYHSGVGWFNDILTTQVFLDTPVETYSVIPHFTRLDPVGPEERAVLARRAAARRRARASRAPAAAGDDDNVDTGDSDDEVEERAREASPRADGTFTTHFAPLVAAGRPVSGVVRLTTPPGRVIPYLSVSVALESALFALEEVATRTLYYEKTALAGEGTLRPGSTDLPFVFLGAGKGLLPESYEGRLFSVRHTLMVRVERPWYTFDVTGVQPFALQRVHVVPALEDEDEEDEDEGGGGGGAGGAPAGAVSGSGKGAGGEPAPPPPPPPPRYAPPPPSPLARQVAVLLPSEVVGNDWRVLGPCELPVEGWPPEKGAISLHLERTLYELSSVVRGHISFTSVVQPIVMVRVAVVRIEYADGEASDATIFDDSVMDARKWKGRRKAGDGGGGVGGGGGSGGGGGDDADEFWPTQEELDAGAAADPDLPILGDVSLSLELDLSQLDLRPTLVISAADDDEEGGEDGGTGAAAVGAKAGAAATNPQLRGGGGDASLDALEAGGEGKRANTAGGGDEISVRYFLRVTLYTAFSANARVWDAQEIILYRNNFYVSAGRDLREGGEAGGVRGRGGGGGGGKNAFTTTHPPPPTLTLFPQGQYVGPWKLPPELDGEGNEAPKVASSAAGAARPQGGGGVAPSAAPSVVVAGTPMNSPPNSHATP